MNKNKIYFPFYIIFISIAMVIVFEYVILPWHFNLPRDIALMGFAGKPNTTVHDTAINSMGFTGDVIQYGKKYEKVRILTLGGSTMFNRRMTERLIESLNNISSRPVEVIGAALPTHTSMSSVIKYRVLSRYKFDYVLIYHGINDLFVNNVYVDHFKSDYSHMLPWYRRNIFLDHSLITRVIYNNFIWGRKIFGMDKIWFIWPKKDMENAMEFVSDKLFRRNITLLIEEIKQDGAVPILMTFAWSIPDNYTLEKFKSGSVGYNNTADDERQPIELWGSVEFVKEGLKKHNAVLRQIAEEYSIFLIDQENLLGNDPYWFGDVCHFSEEGTDKFIENIKDFIISEKSINM